MVGWLLALVPALSALVAWAALGGHLHAPETLNLLLGHLLYGLLVAAIGLFAAAVAEGPATAAIAALAFVLGAWVLDFAAAGQRAPGCAAWPSCHPRRRSEAIRGRAVQPARRAGHDRRGGRVRRVAVVWLPPGRPVRGRSRSRPPSWGRRPSSDSVPRGPISTRT